MTTNKRDIQTEAELRPSASRAAEQTEGRRWVLRGAGAALLVAGWGIVSFVGAPLVSAVVFGLLGAYAYIAAAASRRTSVDDEKRLRMDLLVHNIELERLASRDDLTQLYNRRYFLKRLDRELQNARGCGRPVSVLFIDIDGMRDINAKHGQRAGDEVLTEFGRFLLAETRASDLPARIDGDCFAVILPETADDGAEIMVERLTTALRGKAMFQEGTTTIEISVSLGAAGYPWSSQTLDEILREAEVATAANRRVKDMSLRIDADNAVPAIFRKAADNEEAL